MEPDGAERDTGITLQSRITLQSKRITLQLRKDNVAIKEG
jgi:hypothetical protein